MYQGFTLHDGYVRTNVRLNLRQGAPLVAAPIAGKVLPEKLLHVQGIGRGDLISGNDIWYAGDNETYFWSGGCASFQSGDREERVPVSGIAVNRYSNGTIKPLSDKELTDVFGYFDYTEGQGGRILINNNWVRENIVPLATPLLASLGYETISIHRKALPSFEAALNSIKSAGLSTKILTCAGTFVPRHKNWDINRGLSSHSWGIAIDLNSQWNGYGNTPAPLGMHGSLREIVPLMEALGFAWGGHFSPQYVDGMHFELARLDL
ncbi:MAG: M15 family metallopeptidase [Nitrosomonas sp.]|nr:M15 family metallopeptidase [Nitrosomonas sp.]